MEAPLRELPSPVLRFVFALFWHLKVHGAVDREGVEVDGYRAVLVDPASADSTPEIFVAFLAGDDGVSDAIGGTCVGSHFRVLRCC